MKELKFRVWHKLEKRMYYRGYQKLLYALLCEEDPASEDGSGRPVKRASYEDCEFLESTLLYDRNRREIFEGDVVRIRFKDKEFVDVVGAVPDMFGSKNLHPLKSILTAHGLPANPEGLDIEVLGNRYEHPQLLA